MRIKIPKLKKSNTNIEKTIKREIMMNLWIYRGLSLLYIGLLLFMPFTSNGMKGHKFQLNYILIIFTIISDLKIRGELDIDIPVIVVSLFIKFGQFFFDYFFFTSYIINYWIFIPLFCIEGLMALLVYMDGVSMEYVEEDPEDIEV